MAGTEHELNIRATIDTTQVQAELDRINQQKGDGLIGARGSGGNDQMSLSFRIKQLQLSIETLNKILQSLSTRKANGGSSSINQSGSNLSLPGLLGTQRDKNLRDMQRIGRDAIASGAITKSDWSSVAAREAFFLKDEGREYGERWREAEAENDIIKKSNINRRQLRWGLATAGLMASSLGENLQGAGYGQAGAAMNILGGALGGAGSGAMLGGPWGAAIGGFIGFVTTAGTELKKLSDAANSASQALYDAQKKSSLTYMDYQNQQKLQGLSRAIESARRKPEDLENYQSQIEAGKAAAQKELVNAKSLYEWYQKSAEQMTGTTEQKTQAHERAIAQLKEVQQAQSDFNQWEDLSQRVKQMFQDFIDQTERNHQEGLRLQKMEEDFRQRLFEQQVKDEEMRKNLLSQREALLLSIEQEYAQNGVDVLSSMGKAGKFMSQMESQSTAQERYAPITKKLDTMQKSLDHLSQIDAKLRTLNTGLL